ncbi:prolyl oligopeptidase family serine peptidase [Streptomyces sp. DSM 42041]|uniref:Prolyl oligopeptidase family serine peptidase n=1 Tax=Streptomyces hazeniae TaxID=3075538 RepID=A0ABU2NMJ7_9ACTN|nr:prolyl oligopeptidase family serine peptidase [Streptomyces sp. DSM 42041]MDT0377974.1 prolyl oligopeptidase family serine peptidase [Streptomyces sp. DSM 42041]
MPTTFPRQHARTGRFTLGVPRAFTVAPDGTRVVFLRSRSGTDPAHVLWVREPDGREYAAADPAVLLGGAAEELSPEERARRERSRETSSGVVAYATDAAVELAAFALSGRLFTAELRAGTARELPAPGPVLDPRPSPDGRLVAYVTGGVLRVAPVDGGEDRAVATPESETVTYGLAEYAAAESMHRYRGFWWSPDSDRLLVARADDGPVGRWWIADPANPHEPSAELAYPTAGTAHAEVGLWLVGTDGGRRTEVRWDRERYPYLARVHWSACGPPVIQVQARDQRSQLYLSVDTTSGATSELYAEEDPTWLELFAGCPAWTPCGRLLRIADADGARRLFAGEVPLSPAGLHVRTVLDIGEHDVLVAASAAGDTGRSDPGDIGVHRIPFDGDRDGGGGGLRRLAVDTGPHVASAVRGGDTVVLTSAALDHHGNRVHVLRLREDGTLEERGTVPSLAEEPVLTAAPLLAHVGKREIPTALLLPTGHRHGDGPLPVLLDPYGGPHGQRVTAARNAYLTSQWFADQGFAVVVADGRGTPGHSPAWEKAISRQVLDVVLEDQIDALYALAEARPSLLDLSRVGIRGWSFGGWLAAMAVLRRPDVFHTAVAGAPVTDQRLYEAHYIERYYGTPQDDPEVYRHNSAVADDGLVEPAGPHRPLLLVHGLADDNVVAAHTLRLSSALLAAGRPHEVLPLSGVTHMTPQEQVAENLLLFQVAFLKRTLGMD